MSSKPSALRNFLYLPRDVDDLQSSPPNSAPTSSRLLPLLLRLSCALDECLYRSATRQGLSSTLFRPSPSTVSHLNAERLTYTWEPAVAQRSRRTCESLHELRAPKHASDNLAPLRFAKRAQQFRGLTASACSVLKQLRRKVVKEHRVDLGYWRGVERSNGVLSCEEIG